LRAEEIKGRRHVHEWTVEAMVAQRVAGHHGRATKGPASVMNGAADRVVGGLLAGRESLAAPPCAINGAGFDVFAERGSNDGALTGRAVNVEAGQLAHDHPHSDRC